MIFDETRTKKWSPYQHLQELDTYKREGEVFVHPSVLGYADKEGELRDEYGHVMRYYDRAKEGNDPVIRTFEDNTDPMGNLYDDHYRSTKKLVKMLEADAIMQPIMRDLLSRLEQMDMKASNGDLHGITRLIRGLQQHVSRVIQRTEKICEIRRERVKGMAA